jgi:membrane protein implicated in regulation of membrane protease activity
MVNPRWPAKCEQCGALSHALSSTSNGIWVGTLLSVAGLSVAAAVLSIPMPVGLAAVAVLALLINVVMWRRVEMVPITSESAQQRRKSLGF